MSSYAEPIPAMSHRSQLHCLNNNNTLPFHSHTMGPRVDLPVNKMPPVNRTPSRASDDGVRKRVGKACDRCRLKKSKCDGFSFCSRCKADNAICVFGDRKRSQDRVYPKGFAEMLEWQQGRMIAAFQEIYLRAQAGNPWTGEGLEVKDGCPKIQDILTDLDVLFGDEDEPVSFETDPQKLIAQLYAQEAGLTRRCSSISSESDRSAHQDYVYTPSDARATPFEAKPDPGEYDFSAPSSRPASQSPAVHQLPMFPTANPNPLVSQHDPQFFQAPWTFPEHVQQHTLLRSNDGVVTGSPMDPSIYNSMETFDTLHLADSSAAMAMDYQGHAQQRSEYFAGPVLYHNPSADTQDVDYNQYLNIVH